MNKRVVVNIGTIVSGDTSKGFLKGDTIIIEKGKISAIGYSTNLNFNNAELVIDAAGMTVTPGLIDSHTHPVIGDWTPRQKAINWMEGALNGGVTTIISQGVVHLPGRPQNRSAAKALAILCAAIGDNYRPGGIKSHQGTVPLEAGLTEQDFREMAENGVKIIGEIGVVGKLHHPEDIAEMLSWARQYGMIVPLHFGARSIPGSARIWSEEVEKIRPDVVLHLNGGPVGAPWPEVKKVIEDSKAVLELVYTGNPKLMYDAIELIKGRNEYHRVLIGSDTPSGGGLIPSAILKCILQIASLNQVPPEIAIAMATGTTSDLYKLNTGKIEIGREADLLIMDAPLDSAAHDAMEAIKMGDLPAIEIIMIDGEIVVIEAANTFRSSKTPLLKVNKGSQIINHC